MKFKNIIQLILITFSLCILSASGLHAGQDTALSFTPIIVLDSQKTQNGEKPLLIQRQSPDNASHFATQNPIHHNNKLQLGDLKKKALALGATFHINDFLNVGAACAVPLTNEEPIQVEDLSIEAMITMQF